MVRSMRFHGAGQPLELVTLPVPELRDSEILVRMTACTLCRSDLQTHAGRRTEATPTVLVMRSSAASKRSGRRWRVPMLQA
jgi:D-arabinose 1-dehydrogenase-like Zn-dependent alcohol dehydrogenase